MHDVQYGKCEETPAFLALHWPISHTLNSVLVLAGVVGSLTAPDMGGSTLGVLTKG